VRVGPPSPEAAPSSVIAAWSRRRACRDLSGPKRPDRPKAKKNPPSAPGPGHLSAQRPGYDEGQWGPPLLTGGNPDPEHPTGCSGSSSLAVDLTDGQGGGFGSRNEPEPISESAPNLHQIRIADNVQRVQRVQRHGSATRWQGESGSQANRALAQSVSCLLLSASQIAGCFRRLWYAHAAACAGLAFRRRESDARLAFHSLGGGRAGGLPPVRPDAIAGRKPLRRVGHGDKRPGSWSHHGDRSARAFGRSPLAARFPSR
jgi:hypothetical protein